MKRWISRILILAIAAAAAFGMLVWLTYPATPISRTTTIQIRPTSINATDGCDLLQLWGSDKRFYVHRDAILTNADMRTSDRFRDSNGQYGLDICFTKKGAETLSKFVRHPDFPMIAIVVDDILMFAGPLTSPIKDRATISGNLTQKEVAEIHFMLTTNTPSPKNAP